MNGRIAYYKAVFQYQGVAGNTKSVFSYGKVGYVRLTMMCVV